MTEADTASALIAELRLIREDNREAHESIRATINGGNTAVSKQITATDLIVSAAGVLVVLIFTVFAYVYTTDRETANTIHKEAATQRKSISDIQIKVTTLLEVLRADVKENKHNIVILQPGEPRFTKDLHIEEHRRDIKSNNNP